MSDRITKTFEQVKKANRAALIPFIMGYDPDAKTSGELLEALADNGADLIEIGLPFSDPMADGPTIQAAGLRALNAGASVKNILELVQNFRKKNSDTPIVLMGYFNPIYRYGNEQFCKDAKAAGVDGLILVDLPPEEEEELTPFLKDAGIHFIRLIAPTSDGDRLKRLCDSASGFIYYVAVAGITGAKSADVSDLQKQVSRLRNHTSLPIAVGFGIKTPEQAKEVSAFADAVVVGSALVDNIHKAEANAADATAKFMSGLTKNLTR